MLERRLRASLGGSIAVEESSGALPAVLGCGSGGEGFHSHSHSHSHSHFRFRFLYRWRCCLWFAAGSSSSRRHTAMISPSAVLETGPPFSPFRHPQPYSTTPPAPLLEMLTIPTTSTTTKIDTARNAASLARAMGGIVVSHTFRVWNV